MKNMRRYLISVQNISPSLLARSLARSLRSCNLYCSVQVDDKTSSAKANVSSSPSKASNSQILDHVNIPSPPPALPAQPKPCVLEAFEGAEQESFASKK